MKKTTLHWFDDRVTSGISSIFGPSFHGFFAIVTRLGDPSTVTILALGLFLYGLAYGGRLPIIAAVAIPSTVIVGAVLKIAFERARPVTEYALNMKIHTFSFPSGHSCGSMVAYGVLGIVLLAVASSAYAPLIVGFSALIPFLVGVSRVYLGAHFPSDVVAGWALGAVGVAVVVVIQGALL